MQPIVAHTRQHSAQRVPRTTPAETPSTVLHACRALIETAVTANELVAFSTGGATFEALVTEFERNGWRNVESRANKPGRLLQNSRF
jgi:hypothetical protein